MAANVTNKTALYGQSRFGVVAIEDQSLSTGNRFFVDSGAADNGTSSGYGRTPDKPFSTVDAAVSACTADNGDIVYVMPGHAENLSAGTSWAHDVAGVSVVGLGTGDSRPTFTFSATAGTVNITASGALLDNLRFTASTSAIVRGIHVKGDYCTIRNCEISSTGASHILVGIEVGAANNDADNLVIENCKILQLDSASVNGIVFMKDQVGVRVEGNWIQGDYAVGGIKGLIAADSAENLTNVLVKDNVLISAAADQAFAINLDGAANTGYIIGNHATAPDADWTPFIAAGCGFSQNYESGALASGSGQYPRGPYELTPP